MSILLLLHGALSIVVIAVVMTELRERRLHRELMELIQYQRHFPDDSPKKPDLVCWREEGF